MKRLVNPGEPPDADPHVRWCERTGASRPLLLDPLCAGDVVRGMCSCRWGPCAHFARKCSRVGDVAREMYSGRGWPGVHFARKCRPGRGNRPGQAAADGVTCIQSEDVGVECGGLRAECAVAGGDRVHISRASAVLGGGIGPRKRLRWGSAGGSINRCGQGPVVRPGHPPIRVCVCEQRGRRALATG